MSSGSADEGGEDDAESSHIYFEALRGQMKEILEDEPKAAFVYVDERTMETPLHVLCAYPEQLSNSEPSLLDTYLQTLEEQKVVKAAAVGAYEPEEELFGEDDDEDESDDDDDWSDTDDEDE